MVNEKINSGIIDLYEISESLASDYTFGNTLNTSEIQNNGINEIYDGEREIREGWEYKIYKLQINEIAPLKGDFMRAKNKINTTPKLKNLIGNDFEIENILPLIIKESRMDNSQVSDTGAKGYLQITGIALKDINKRYGLEDLKLNREDPVDNLIIGIIYYMKRNMEIINSLLKKSGKKYNFSEKDKKELNILSYNIGAPKMVELLTNSNAKSLSEFKNYLRKSIGCSGPIQKKTDSHYKVEYYDLLDGKDKSEFKGDENQKIAEGLRYLEIINGLELYIEEETTITSIGTIDINEGSLFSQVKALREQGVFKDNSSINEICKVILETNGFKETETPAGVELILVKEALSDFLN